MSIVAFKRKSVVQHSHISGRSPGGTWIPRTPGIAFTNNNGFSINGSHRNKGAVGSSSAFSKSKTIFKGNYAVGCGGYRNQYYDIPLFNVTDAITVKGTQYKYVKPSVLSNKGMLSMRYKWLSGQYPNYWVKNYTGYLTDTYSQSVYINNKTYANICNDSINTTASQYIQSIPRECNQKPNITIERTVKTSCGF